MRIKQASVAEESGFFKNGLFERWGFEEYHDKTKPTFFFGIDYQFDKINEHEGLKVIYIISPYDSIFLNKLNNSDNLYVINSPFIVYDKPYKVKNIEIELKDYSLFQPNKLGNKVYSYLGWEWRLQEFKIDMLREIQKHINYEIVFGIRPGINHYHDIKSHKEEFYDDCFVNLNLTHGTGMTTARELGLMGRKTIMNTGYNFPSIVKYRDFEDIIYLINDEAKKIGTVQEKIDCHNVGEEWLETEFWTKELYHSERALTMRNSMNTKGLLDLIDELPNKMVMAEVGVYAGESTKIFMNSGKINKMYSIDLWDDPKGVYKKMYSDHDFSIVEKIFDLNLANYNIQKMKGSFENQIDLLPELDCVYIDGSHEYIDVMNDINLSLSKIKKGGYICGHDYTAETPGVIKAISEFFGKPDKIFDDSSWVVRIN